MYYIAKIAQATGLTIVVIDFARTFPSLMSRKVLLAGVMLFTFGWIVERYFLKR